MGTNGSATTVPANKTLTLTGDAKGKVTNASGGEGEEDGKIVLDNISVAAGEELDLSGATGVEFKGTTAVSSGSTLKLPADLKELPKLTGTGTVAVTESIEVPKDGSGNTLTDAGEILAVLQDALGMTEKKVTKDDTTSDQSKTVYTVSITAATAFTGDKTIGAYSSVLTMKAAAAYTGGSETSAVSFHMINIPSEKLVKDAKVAIKYKTDGEYTALGSSENNAIFGSYEGSTISEALANALSGDEEGLSVVLPLCTNVTSLQIEVTAPQQSSDSE